MFYRDYSSDNIRSFLLIGLPCLVCLRIRDMALGLHSFFLRLVTWCICRNSLFLLERIPFQLVKYSFLHNR
jgi:hypothetical protein